MRIYLIALIPLLILAKTHCGQIIDQAGVYSFGNNLFYTPTSNDDAIIKITASNVTIDLSQSILSQADNDFTPGLDGIWIASNLKNITIKNGAIRHISGTGICVNDGCSNITIQDCDIQSCNEAGIIFNGDIEGTGISIGLIKKCILCTCTGADGGSAYGIKFVSTNDVEITDCLVDYNDAGLTSSGFGIYLESCSNIDVDNCNVISSGGSPLTAGIAGINCEQCNFEAIKIKNNTVYDTTTTGSACGFYFDGCNNMVCYLCTSAHAMNSLPTGLGSFGALSQNSTNNTFANCCFDSNVGASLSAGVLLFNDSQTFITNCTSRNNQTIISGNAYGVYLYGITNDVCSVVNNSLLNNAGIAYGFDVIDDRPDSTSSIQNNYSFNNIPLSVMPSQQILQLFQ